MALAAVRPATVTDVDEIVRIQAVTWSAAFAELVPPTALDELTGPAARRAWTAAVDANDGRHHVVMATEGSWTVGFCAAAASVEPTPRLPDPGRQDRDPTRPELGAWAWGEITVLLVEPRWGRRGHGGRLLVAATTALREAGSRFGLTWIPEDDAVSLRFYERAGWTPDGAVRGLDTGAGTLREIRLTGSVDLRLRDDGR